MAMYGLMVAGLALAGSCQREEAVCQSQIVSFGEEGSVNVDVLYNARDMDHENLAMAFSKLSVLYDTERGISRNMASQLSVSNEKLQVAEAEVVRLNKVVEDINLAWLESITTSIKNIKVIAILIFAGFFFLILAIVGALVLWKNKSFLSAAFVPGASAGQIGKSIMDILTTK